MNNEQAVKKTDTPYRKTYVLKQETPMIHFQHGDSGVVIRASEFKPKLDKFLLKKLGGNLSDKKHWLLKQSDTNQNKENQNENQNEKQNEKQNEIQAFNYKVRIFATGEPERSETIKKATEYKKGEKYLGINNMYFGNKVKKGENYNERVRATYKETIFYKTDIYVEIQCFVKGLLTFIDANMDEFLLVTNFGTRQSKGFGCFSLKNEGEKTPIEILQKGKYDFVYGEIEDPSNSKTTENKKNSNKSLADVKLEVAAGIYAVMKGGINFRNIYVKGYIQRQYLNEIGKKNIGSDKAFMKAKIIQEKFLNKEGYENFESYSDYQYVRAILGIPESIRFKKDKIDEITVKIEDKDKGVERFQSAIQIVVSGKYVILIMKDSYKAILGKEFEFSAGKNRQNIKVPSEFNPNQFLSGFVKYFNKEKGKLAELNYQEASKVELKMGREGKK